MGVPAVTADKGGILLDNFDALQSFYTGEAPEELRLSQQGPQYLEFEVASHYMDTLLPPGSRVLDSCAGTGAYAFYLAARGHSVVAGDIVPRNVELMRERQTGAVPLAEIYEGDALDLSRFAAGSFDAVLCMGALYHLHTPEERQKALEQSMRVCKKDGLVFFTYMNRYAVIANNCLSGQLNLDEMLSFAREGAEGVFYASTPEEMAALAQACGLSVVKHLSLDGMGLLLFGAGALGLDGLRQWKTYHLATCETPSLLGSGYHNMIVARV